MIGRLDQKITLQRATRTPDGGGGKVVSWADLPEDPRPFAKVELRGSDETDRASGAVARQRARFTIRARSDIKATDRILWGGYVWNIHATGRPVARARYQVIEAISGEVSA
ncbi:phage head closure protein [Roseovarius sp. C03]|uniref:phage head closure protein n=1 Tax=Roseovarius sp. C03 TaxID=3449222 RepID=UPI003EDC2955